MKPTLSFRHVWRTVNDGTEDVKVLALQQWWLFFHDDDTQGMWEDVEISLNEPNQGPDA